jgi:hypothetical protein
MLPYLEWAGEHTGLAVIILLCWTFLVFCVLSGFFRLFHALVGGVTTPYSTEVEEEAWPEDLEDLLEEYQDTDGMTGEQVDALANRIARRTIEFHDA